MKVLPRSVEKCLADYKDSLEELKDIRDLAKSKGLNEKLEQKIIRVFEITHELALTTIGEYFKKEGRKPFSGSRDATVDAFHEDLIDDGEGWLDMIICRIKYNPIYPEDYQPVLVQNILGRYIKLFENFERKMSAKLGD
ncbi:hypothetical protein P872_24895 [Rhodonellum psychrophilum GCM71 = DSM 17998]|uniref:Nucleotidyltransferase n=2 Tax=Rhodonellum TaxID=336827 RepID=U5C892_9BACT|nr:MULTISPECIES: nucleotidyltransferase substrate binding protein [Rhodonellum]ERM84397.1 hypothetical protein P872_24895 [Rhodonellum psychrophilum GCM71 = DSM 17998]MDO9553995.1 nucleotidyltransferase substrate binding protein [Rhodonellum sp.]SDY99174.1 nucleotidyltransferase substrate binding protein, HI0074 family [Rhodonellum ikkaensis]